MPLSNEIGLQIPSILLPKSTINLQKWAVIACDQFTSEPEYWQKVEDIVGEEPSTYQMILPEVFLETAQENQRIQNTYEAMHRFIKSEIFKQFDGFIYVLRKLDNGQVRRGLMVCLDLEHYDYHQGAQTLIRATEGTILDRLPPRIRIREQAALELPHILVLFDDPNDTVFSEIDERLMQYDKLYDFDLMLGSGHLSGYALDDEAMQMHILQSLKNLINPEMFAEKYNLIPGKHQPLLFAMGDGNHSLATAKALWEKIKPEVGMDHPARYALVEIENVHDPALTFEPIHRLLFDLNKAITNEMRTFWGEKFNLTTFDDFAAMQKIVDEASEPWHQVGMIDADGIKLLEIKNPSDNLPVGTLQKFLDVFMEGGGAEKIDYVHGTEVLTEKGAVQGNVGFYVPGIDKSDLFKTVILDGALPRKTFSMGEAKDKRFYMECRQIQSE